MVLNGGSSKRVNVQLEGDAIVTAEFIVWLMAVLGM